MLHSLSPWSSQVCLLPGSSSEPAQPCCTENALHFGTHMLTVMMAVRSLLVPCTVLCECSCTLAPCCNSGRGSISTSAVRCKKAQNSVYERGAGGASSDDPLFGVSLVALGS